MFQIEVRNVKKMCFTQVNMHDYCRDPSGHGPRSLIRADPLFRGVGLVWIFFVFWNFPPMVWWPNQIVDWKFLN